MMKHVKLFEEWQAINEIGEGGSPFQWKRIGGLKIEHLINGLNFVDKADTNPNWTQLGTVMYEFSSDKATYEVKIATGWKRHVNISFGKPGKKQHDFDIAAVVSFDIKGNDYEPVITNFGEQFRVISTVSEITTHVVMELEEWEWIKLQEIRIQPKLEADDMGKPLAHSKRGRLYLEYVKKQGRKLPGKWSVEIDKELFTIKRGQWTSTNPERYINI